MTNKVNSHHEKKIDKAEKLPFDYEVAKEFASMELEEKKISKTRK